MVVSSIYEEAVEAFGKDNQLMVTMGELAECTAELAKVFISNRTADEAAILDELADVCIMMQQMHVIYGDELTQSIHKKLGKLRKHLDVKKEANYGK